MSTRELAYSIFDRLTDEQLEGFVLMFRNAVPTDDKLSPETSAAIEECERMLADPNTVTYSVEEALKELKS
ncbi:MAG: hypothetical protein SOU50_00890 [Oscillospiraceae bacterium]|nr:hypothetical protein [Oscillospiraceae bacterium]MDY2846758.1 hypothetical protein [Oscillospiraceae bacterium]